MRSRRSSTPRRRRRRRAHGPGPGSHLSCSRWRRLRRVTAATRPDVVDGRVRVAVTLAVLGDAERRALVACRTRRRARERHDGRRLDRDREARPPRRGRRRRARRRRHDARRDSAAACFVTRVSSPKEKAVVILRQAAERARSFDCNADRRRRPTPSRRSASGETRGCRRPARACRRLRWRRGPRPPCVPAPRALSSAPRPAIRPCPACGCRAARRTDRMPAWR